MYVYKILCHPICNRLYICTISSELNHFLIFTHLSELVLISTGFQRTSSTPAGFQEAFRVVMSHVCIHVSFHAYTYIYIYMSIHVYTCIYKYQHLSIHKRAHVPLYTRSFSVAPFRITSFTDDVSTPAELSVCVCVCLCACERNRKCVYTFYFTCRCGLLECQCACWERESIKERVDTCVHMRACTPT